MVKNIIVFVLILSAFAYCMQTPPSTKELEQNAQNHTQEELKPHRDIDSNKQLQESDLSHLAVEAAREAAREAADAVPAEPVVQSKDYSALWLDPKWDECVASYKRTFEEYATPNFYRYISQNCGESDEQLKSLHEGDCFMRISGPNRTRNSKSYEIELVCVKQSRSNSAWISQDMICTNRNGYYADWVRKKMVNDKRCKGFPNLISENLDATAPAFSTEEIHQIKKYETTGRYEDLPSSLRFDNRNTDAKCHSEVEKVRKLENDAAFDTDREIRLQWQRQFEYASSLGCTL